MTSHRLRRRLSLAVCAIALPGLLAACGSSSTDVGAAATGSKAPLNSQLPAALQKAGKLTIASNVEYPPFEFYDKDNKTILGIDRAIADELEKQLGVKINFENIAFDAIIPGLASGRYQMAMSAMTDNKERQKQVDFVDYFQAGAGVMVRTADKGKISTLEDLCGVKVGIVKGTTEVPQADVASKQCVADGKKKIDSTVFPGQNQTILALQNNRVEAVLMDSAPGAYAAAQAKGLYMNTPYEAQPFGIVFAKNAGALSKVVQKALVAIEKDGSYMTALKKYGLESGAAKEFPINGGTQ